MKKNKRKAKVRNMPFVVKFYNRLNKLGMHSLAEVFNPHRHVTIVTVPISQKILNRSLSEVISHPLDFPKLVDSDATKEKIEDRVSKVSVAAMK